MTPEELRKLDAEVAEEVFGYVEVYAPIGDGLSRTANRVGTTFDEASARLREAYAGDPTLRDPYYCGPHYSTSIAAAWKVVEKLRELGYSFGLWTVPACSSVMSGYRAAFAYSVHPPEMLHPGTSSLPHSRLGWAAVADEAPEAICRAAWEAVRGREHEPAHASCVEPTP